MGLQLLPVFPGPGVRCLQKSAQVEPVQGTFCIGPEQREGVRAPYFGEMKPQLGEGFPKIWGSNSFPFFRALACVACRKVRKSSRSKAPFASGRDNGKELEPHILGKLSPN